MAFGYDARDTQRQRVYDFEHYLPDTAKMSLDDCTSLIQEVVRAYSGGGAPCVADGRGTRIARGGAWRISLPKWARTHRTVLHEAAHCIVHRRIGQRIAPHGPEFVAVFLELYHRFVDSGLSRAQVRSIARASRIKGAPRKRIPKVVERCRFTRERVERRYGRMPIVKRPPASTTFMAVHWYMGRSYVAAELRERDALIRAHVLVALLREHGIFSRMEYKPYPDGTGAWGVLVRMRERKRAQRLAEPLWNGALPLPWSGRIEEVSR